MPKSSPDRGLRWAEHPSAEQWELIDDLDYKFTTVPSVVAVVTRVTKGVTTREYVALITKTNERMVFNNLRDAQTWALTTYRLTK